MPTDPISELRGAVGAAIAAVGGDLGAEEPSLERPPDAGLGHYSTNAAMRLASQLRDAPRSIAERLGAELESGLGTVERVEVAGPGFLNLFFADAWHREAVVRILAAERKKAGNHVPREGTSTAPAHGDPLREYAEKLFAPRA